MKSSRRNALLGFAVAGLLLAVIVLWARVWSGPPRKIRFAAGNSSGAYFRFAERYRDILQASGLEVEILETKGSGENLELIESGRADIGFVQSGQRAQSETAQLRSLGSVFYEPVWVFVNGNEPPKEFLNFENKRVAIGSKGSGTRLVALALLSDNKLLGKVETVEVDLSESEPMLLRGEIDAIIIVGSASIPSVKTLAATKNVSLINFERAKAYSRYHQSLSAVTLYRGMLDLAKDVPSSDHQLVASSTNLIVKENFHYALVTLVLQTAQKIHQDAGPFNDYNEFPNPNRAAFPLLEQAEDFYRRGPSFFFRNLPFYAAATLDRLIIILIPLLTLLIPLGRILPPIYEWYLNRNLYDSQADLAELEINSAADSNAQRLSSLAELEERIPELKKLPAALQNDVFLLQMRIDRFKTELSEKVRESEISQLEQLGS